jgi:photosystem II stability/assembly factor-like uncharacterized protein
MRFLFLLILLPFAGTAQEFTLIPLTSGTNTSIRGLSVIDDQHAWVSGSNGHIGKTSNGGKDWTWTKPASFEQLDFRDIEAFDDQNAVIVNAGSPAFILLTTDGGKTWKQSYVNRDSSVFLDGMDFWDANRGMIFGDPLKGKLHLLKTVNGGATWVDISDHLKQRPKLGEAGFAASGTTIKTLGDGKVWIATGGAAANIYYSSNYGGKWKRFPNPIIQGINSTGPFSLDFFDEKHGLIVGGDYLKDQESTNNALYTKNGGKSWIKPINSVSGYRSAVVYLTKDLCIAAGSSGIDYSKDGGNNWKHISDLNINAVKKAKSGNLVLLAGNKGQIYRLDIKP